MDRKKRSYIRIPLFDGSVNGKEGSCVKKLYGNMLEVAMDSKQYLANLQVPAGRVDAVLDTDTYNEIDDQFALSYMFLSPEKFNLKAIYAAPFFNSHSTSPKDGMERSYDEIMKLLGLLGRNEYMENV